MEFKIVKVTSGIAIFNYQELKQQLQEKLNDYKGYLVTNENLTQAKSDRALLNKVKKAISDERIRVKKEILKLYDTTFEPQCKELISLIDDVAVSIDNQIKGLEESAKQTKLVEIKNMYYSLVENVDYIPDTEKYLEQIWNEKWLNKSYSLNDIKKEIQEALDKVSSDLGVIDKMVQSEVDKAEVKVEYFKTLNLSTALDEFNSRKELKEKVISKPNFPKAEINEKVDNVEKNISITLRVSGTKAQLIKLGEFLKANSISYEQIF